MNVLCGCHGIRCSVAKECWAKKQAKRKKPYFKNGKKYGCGMCYDFIPHIHVERLDEPLRVKKPSVIGLNFMADTFDEHWTAESLRWVWNAIFRMCRHASWHTFVILTKQPQNIPVGFEFSSNVWLGVSVNCKADLWRIDKLREASAAVKLVSFEPLQEDLGEVNLAGVNWVIIGAQTKPDVQPKSEWVTSLMLQCKERGIPIFMKDNLKGWSSLLHEYPKPFFIRVNKTAPSALPEMPI